MRLRFLAPALPVALALAAPLAAQQQQDFSKVEVKAEKVAEGVYMLTGRAATSVSRWARAAAS